MKIREKLNEMKNKSKEEKQMSKWSLKKKVLVGIGVMAAGAVGLVAYGRSKPETEVEYDDEYEDEDDYDSEESDDDDHDEEFDEEEKEAQE